MITLCDVDQQNLNVLAAAFENRDIALIECQVIAIGEVVPVICAVNRKPGGKMDLVPFAELFRGDQYERLSLPRSDGNGFVSQAELRGELN
jgi:hypothetical protein